MWGSLCGCRREWEGGGKGLEIGDDGCRGCVGAMWRGTTGSIYVIASVERMDGRTDR